MIGLATATLTLAALAAQGPTRPPEDLTRLANHLDTDGSVASILALYPRDAAAELIARAKQLTPSEREAVLDEIEPTRSLVLAAAISELNEVARRPPSTPRALLRQAKAALQVAQATRLGKFFYLHFGDPQDPKADPNRDKIAALAAPAQACLRATLAKLLREHPDSPEVVSALLLANELAPARELTAAILARGLPASRAERLDLVDTLLRQGDLDSARRVLDAVGAGSAAILPERREALAERQQDAGERIEQARLWQAKATDPDAHEARLQFLRYTDFAAACAASRGADASTGGLPAMLLALEAHRDGDLARARALIDRALAAGDVETAVVFLDVLVSMAEARLHQSRNGADLVAKRSQVYARADAHLRDDPSEPAMLFRGLRALGWPMDYQPASHDVLHALVQAVPRSTEAAVVLYAGCCIDPDTGAALALLREPLPDQLVVLPRLLRARAEAAVCVALRHSDPQAAAELVRDATADLEAATGDASLANYLRGLAAWNPRAPDATALLAARSYPTVGERAWPIQAAALTAQVLAGGLVRAGGMPRARRLHGNDLSAADHVSVVVAALHVDPSRRQERLTRDLVKELGEDSAAAAVLHTALAAACARDADRGGARAHAEHALQARAKFKEVVLSLLDRGILLLWSFGWSINVSPTGPALEVQFEQTLYPLPPLPGADQLEKWRRGDQ